MRTLKELWQIVYDNFEDFFDRYYADGLCYMVVKMYDENLLTWPEATLIRDDIKEDEFWAREIEVGRTYWETRNKSKRIKYLEIKCQKS